MNLRFSATHRWLVLFWAVVFAYCMDSVSHCRAQPIGASEPSRDRSSGDENETVAADLQLVYTKTESASSLSDYAEIIAECRSIAGDTTRPVSERGYAKRLLSWSANRRGELYSDRAGQMVQSQQVAEATQQSTQQSSPKSK